MFKNRIVQVFLALSLCTCLGAAAQNRKDTFLQKLFHNQGGIKLFSQVDEIRNLQKEKVKKYISFLTPMAKAVILKRSNAQLELPWPMLTMVEFNQFKLNGNRVGYEQKYFARRSKLTHMIIGELVEQKGRFIDEIINGLGLVLEEPTWALPAHMYLQKAGEGLPDVEEPVIDLFVGQTAMVLSWTKFMLGDQLRAYSPLLVKRIDSELEKRVFQPYLQRDDFWWMGFNERRMNNWNVYVNTNVLISALLIQNNAEIRNKVIAKSIRSVDNYLNSQPLDGGCDEGPSYWGIAGGALVDYIDQLSIYSNQQMDFSQSNLIHNIGSYIYKVHINKNHYVNFADAQLEANQDVGKIYRYGRLFNDKNLLGFAAYLNIQNKVAENFEMNHLHAFFTSLALQDNLAGITPRAPQPKSSWFPDIQVFTARETEGTADGLFFGAKAGTNYEAHNHNDVGSFVIYKNGNPVIVDPGVGTYTKQTFGPDRYQLWYTQSAWHNCPTINGIMQQAGKGYQSKDVSYREDQNRYTFAMDLSPAYPKTAEVIKWRRELTFNSTDKSVGLKEAYQLKSFKKSSVLSFMVCGTVTELKDGRLKLINYQGDVIYLTYPVSQFVFSKEWKDTEDPKLKHFWTKGLTRITLTQRGKSLTGDYQILFN